MNDQYDDLEQKVDIARIEAARAETWAHGLNCGDLINSYNDYRVLKGAEILARGVGLAVMCGLLYDSARGFENATSVNELLFSLGEMYVGFGFGAFSIFAPSPSRYKTPSKEK